MAVNDAEADPAIQPTATARKVELARKQGGRTVLLFIVSMVAAVELLILVRPLLN